MVTIDARACGCLYVWGPDTTIACLVRVCGIFVPSRTAYPHS